MKVDDCGAALAASCYFLLVQKVTKKDPENQYTAWFSDYALICVITTVMNDISISINILCVTAI